MSLAPVAASKAPIAYAQVRTAILAEAPAAPAAQAERVQIRVELTRPAAEAAFAARTAESARFDCRLTGPTETVRSFDRLALVIEGFEHLRETFEGARAQIRSEFGLAGGEGEGARGLDIRA